MATPAVILPVIETEIEEPTWESVLSELQITLRSGFDRLDTTIRETLENPRLVETLTAANTQLTQQITQMNESLVSRLDLLTRPPLEPTPIILVPTLPLLDTPNPDESEIVPLEVPPEESTLAPTPRKRRTI